MKPRDQIIARMYVVLTLLGVLPLLVVWQIMGVDFADGDRLRTHGTEQASSLQDIPAVRGSIYDTAGRSLVVNTKRYDFAVDPTVEGFEADAERLYAKLSQITGRPSSYFRSKVARRSSKQYAMLWRNLPEADMDEIREMKISGLAPGEAKFTRRYNHKTLLAHVLGHVNTDLNGIAGIELQYDTFLTGQSGKRVRKVDRLGKTTAFVGRDDRNPKHGDSIYLTIDLVGQSIVEEELARGVDETGTRWAAVIAVRPHTGEILAMANMPTYDPNRPAVFSEFEKRNRSVTDLYEPGSTFKLVSIVSALEERVARLTDSVDTGNGYKKFGGKAMHDTRAHGVITLAEAISESSNIGIATTAEAMDSRDLYQHARDLGFGQRTYVDMPGEAAGFLKNPTEWSGTTKTSMSIGYEVMVTPLQVLMAYAALANDGLLVQPHIVKERRNFDGEVVWRARPDSIRRAFKARTARELIPAFVEVVETGTAESAQIEGLRVAGKTGTAWKVVNGSYDRSRSRATFVGFFPADDPQVAMIVVMDEPKTSTYGGVVSAPVFQRIAKRWLPTLPDAEKYFDSDEESIVRFERLVPSVEGLPLAIAQSELEAAGFVVKTNGATPDAIVKQQTPNAGVLLAPHSRIVLAAYSPEAVEEDKKIVMPDLSGLGVRQAVFWLATKGISATIEGSGTVKKQYPAAGNTVVQQARLVAR